MKKETKRTAFVAFSLGVFCSLMLFRACVTNTHEVETDTVTVYSIHLDTVRNVDTVYCPQIVSVNDTVYLPGRIDTVKVIEDYYTAKFYSDTLQDSTYKMVINDTVFRNEIVSRCIESEVYSKTKYITKTITNTLSHPNNSFYAGADISYSLASTRPGISPFLAYAKHKSLYRVSFCYPDRVLLVGYGVKIF